jgi:hypothetical protein
MYDNNKLENKLGDYKRTDRRSSGGGGELPLGGLIHGEKGTWRL